MSLALPTRLALGALAFVGSAVYALSFIGIADSRWTIAMSCVGIAAGLSWVVFGLVLLAVTRRRVRLGDWVDTCLMAMGLGIGIKMASVVINILPGRPAPLAAHVTILAVADLAMGTLFVLRSIRLRVGVAEAAAYWLTLNALFAALLICSLYLAGVLS